MKSVENSLYATITTLIGEFISRYFYLFLRNRAGNSLFKTEIHLL